MFGGPEARNVDTLIDNINDFLHQIYEFTSGAPYQKFSSWKGKTICLPNW